jgi:gliding motility-associated-like protein
MKRLQFFLLSLLLAYTASASHIIGGDITVKSLGSNRFKITLLFFRDCSSSVNFDDPIPLGIYDKVTNAQFMTDSMKLISITPIHLGDSCFSPPNLCVEQGLFIDTISLPNNPHGYYLSWERCCRNGVISNLVSPGTTGMVFYAEVPDPALFDSTPVFGTYPKAYMCVNQPNLLNFSATDADGDSLVYSLVKPYKGHTTASTSTLPNPLSAPYDTVTFLYPNYGMFNIVGGIPAMKINRSTGIISASPNVLGIFVFCVQVDEYRNHVKIGEIRRDIQYEVLACQNNLAPVFVSPAGTAYSIVAGDSLCLRVAATDYDGDWVMLKGSSPMFDGTPGIPSATFTPDSAQGTAQSIVCIQTTCAEISETPIRMHFVAKDHSCYPSNSTSLDIDITVKPPREGRIDTTVANVFTPNGDGIHDTFRISSEHISPCFDTFHIQIYDRWGVLLFESGDFQFQWDGKNKSGKEVTNGVYYYVMTGTFRSSNVMHTGFVHLLR